MNRWGVVFRANARLLGAGAALAVLCLLLGYRLGDRHAWIRARRAAAGPEVAASVPAQWAASTAPATATPPPAAAPTQDAQAPLVLAAAMPLRITWPLDAGPPDDGPEACRPPLVEVRVDPERRLRVAGI